MSPERSPSRVSIASKPYIRDTFALSPPARRCRIVALPQDPPTPKKRDSTGQLGFPTLAQYYAIEEGYIDSLTSRRKGKALISQELFDRIWHVLHNNDTTSETAQFRFWVRKMFALSKTYTLCGEPRPIGREVLLHDGLLVAVREHIYELLCYYHGTANHGGRDKTCASLRKHYTWVPKDLVAQFVKACPTCIFKKCGRTGGAIVSAQPRVLSNSPMLSSDAGRLEVKKEDLSPMLPSLKGSSCGTDCASVLLDSLPGTSITPHPQLTLPLGPTPVNQLNRCNPFLLNPLNTPADFSNKEPRGGLKYRSANYRNAGNEYLDTQLLAPTMSYTSTLDRTHPDIPDVPLLFKPGFEDAINFKAEDAQYSFDGQPSTSTMSPLGDVTTSPSLATSSTVGGESPEMPFNPFLLELPLSMEFPSSGGISPISRKDVLLSGARVDGKGVRMISIGPLYLGPGPNNVNSTEAPAPGKLKSWDSVQGFGDFFVTGEDLNLELPVSGNMVADAKDNGQFWGGKDSVYGNDSGNSSSESSVRSDVSDLSLGAAGMSGSGSPASINTPVTGTVGIFGLSTGDIGGDVSLGNVFQDICFGDFED